MRARLMTALLILIAAFNGTLIGGVQPPENPSRFGAALSIQANSQQLYYLPLVHSDSKLPFTARHVIVMIGDGMGLEHVKAGSIYLTGREESLAFSDFPYYAEMMTGSANSPRTDSAAASTAMATGVKVNNGVISEALPGDGRELLTLLEYARDFDMRTGLVTTTPVYDATPAGFGAHAEDRSLSAEIVSDYLTGSRPNVIFGGGGPVVTVEKFTSAGYTVVKSRSELMALDTETLTYVSGQFGSTSLPYEVDGLGDLPHLSEMAAAALRILDNGPDGFFVVIEGGKIDTASHKSDTERMLGEVVEFSRAVEAVLDWADTHPDTLIIIMSDHETGGLRVIQNNGAGEIPDVTWEGEGHTDANVGVWYSGPEHRDFPGIIDNSDIPALLSGGRFRQP